MIKRITLGMAMLFFIGMMSVSAFAQNNKSMNIIKSLEKQKTFKSFLRLVKATGLAKTLSSGGVYTVFAPDDNAFKNLPKGTEALWMKPENKNLLRAIITYHVIEGAKTSTDFKQMFGSDRMNQGQDGQLPHGSSDIIQQGINLKTLQGADLTLKVSDKGSITVNNANVIMMDQKASNGVIHVIDQVLEIPKMPQ